MGEVFEFRGVDNLVYAEVTEDTKENYTTGEVKSLAATAEIGKTVETSTAAKYYDNKAMININSEGTDEIKITCAALDLETLADINGKKYDKTAGALIDTTREVKYFAIGYRTKGTDGKYRYVWRYKGTFDIPEESSATEDNGTDSKNQELTFTGIYTIHEFGASGAAKGVVVDTRKSNKDVSTFFNAVLTPDKLNE